MRHGFEDLDLDRLRRRRSEKWRAFPPDVLPAFIAEMDYDLAESVVAALRSALDLDDCGYANPGGVGETFARFAAARHGWTVDPALVHLVPDVMAGVDLILALATEPGDGVVINTPVYPPFFAHISNAGRRVVEVPLVRRAIEEPQARPVVEEPQDPRAVEEPQDRRMVEEPLARRVIEEPLAPRAVEEPQDQRMVEEPQARRVIEEPRARPVVEEPLVRRDGRWELDFGALEAAFAAGARGYLLCNPHNPTGRVFSAADLGRIAALAERYGVIVLADEIHASLTLPGARHTPYVSLGGPAAEHGVTLASASKAFNVAGLKAAVAVAGSPVMQRLLDRLPAASQYGAGLFGVLASLAAWDSGGEWLDALLGQLDHARAEFGTLLARRLPQAEYHPPEASYLAWVDVSRLGLGPDPAQVFLDRGRVALGVGPRFGAPGEGHVRVTIGTSSALLADIVDRMAAAVG